MCREGFPSLSSTGGSGRPYPDLCPPSPHPRRTPLTPPSYRRGRPETESRSIEEEGYGDGERRRVFSSTGILGRGGGTFDVCPSLSGEADETPGPSYQRGSQTHPSFLEVPAGTRWRSGRTSPFPGHDGEPPTVRVSETGIGVGADE